MLLNEYVRPTQPVVSYLTPLTGCAGAGLGAGAGPVSLASCREIWTVYEAGSHLGGILLLYTPLMYSLA